MIGFLQGTLLRSSPGLLLVDVHGVGYEVRIPLSTYYEIERVGGDGPVRLHIHTNVREDAIELFGFWTEQEKAVFLKLIGVSGIGPRLAQAVLSGMAPPQLLSALGSGDVAALCRIPGIGKKTAERMVLELKDAAQKLSAEAPEPPQALQDDLVQALINLGYRAAEADRAVAAAQRENPDAAFHELLRSSLKRLSKV